MKLRFHLCKLIPRSYRAIVVVSVVATAVGAHFTSKLSLESDLAALLPNSFPSVQALDRMRDEVGGGVSKLRVVLKSQDFPALQRLAGDLKPRLDASEYVLYSRYQNEVDFYQKNALLFLNATELDSLYDAVQDAIDDEKQAINPFMIDDLFGPPPSAAESDDDEAKSDLEAWDEKYRDSEKPRLDASEYVLYSRYQNEVDFYQKNALLFLNATELDSLYDAVQDAIDDEKQAINPFMIDDLFGPPPSAAESDDDEAKSDLEAWDEKYRDSEPKPFYTNQDSTVLVIEVLAAEESVNIAFSRVMLTAVQDIVQSIDPSSYAPDMEVYYGSNIKNRIDEYEALRRDIFGTAVYGVIGVFLLLLLYFRSLTPPILIAITLLASLAWTFGVTYLLIGQLNTITGFLFVVLFGLGIDYGIHAFARYRESRQAGLDRAQGLHNMVCETGGVRLRK